MQDRLSFSSRTIRHFQAGRIVMSKQDDSLFPTETICRCHSPKMHMPLFGEFGQSSRDSRESLSDSHKSQDDRLNSPKSGRWIFKSLTGLKIARMAMILTILGRNRSQRPQFFFKSFRWREMFFASTKKRQRTKEWTKMNEGMNEKVYLGRRFTHEQNRNRHMKDPSTQPLK